MEYFKKIALIVDINPVEALAMLSMMDEPEEEWNEENALAAAIIPLLINGYIMPREKNGENICQLSAIGQNALKTENVREYEYHLLKAFQENDAESLLDAISFSCFDWKKYFLLSGICTKIPKKFWFIKYHETVFSDFGLQAIQFLKDKRAQIKAMAEANRDISQDLLPYVYAFPSLNLGGSDYLKNITSIADMVEEIESVRTSTMCVMASVVAATTVINVSS